MKFHKPDDIPVRNDETVFRASPTRAAIWFAVFSGIGIALLMLGIGGGKRFGLRLPPIVFSYFGAAFFGLMGLMSFGQFRASIKPSNWLVRCNGSGIVIKYRSFLNWQFPSEDVQAVGIEYSEIAWVRRAKEQRIVPSMDRRSEYQNLTYLEIGLANADTSALEAHLQAEQRAEPPGKLVKTIVRDYPVEVCPGGVIRVRWKKSGQYGITPSIGRAIDHLRPHVKIAPSESAKIDFAHRSKPSLGAEDARILELARSGDKIAAVELAREVYGSTLTEAVAYVEKLQSGS